MATRKKPSKQPKRRGGSKRLPPRRHHSKLESSFKRAGIRVIHNRLDKVTRGSKALGIAEIHFNRHTFIFSRRRTKLNETDDNFAVEDLNYLLRVINKGKGDYQNYTLIRALMVQYDDDGRMLRSPFWKTISAAKTWRAAIEQGKYSAEDYLLNLKKRPSYINTVVQGVEIESTPMTKKETAGFVTSGSWGVSKKKP